VTITTQKNRKAHSACCPHYPLKTTNNYNSASPNNGVAEVITLTTLRRYSIKLWENKFIPLLKQWGFKVTRSCDRRTKSTIFQILYGGRTVGELWIKDFRKSAWIKLYLFLNENAIWAVVSEEANKVWTPVAFRKSLSYIVAAAARGEVRCYNNASAVFYSNGESQIKLFFRVSRSYWVWEAIYYSPKTETEKVIAIIEKPLSESPLETFKELERMAVLATTL